MANFTKRATTLRVQTPLGLLVIVKHPLGVRVGQTFSDTTQRGTLSWFAYCVDYYGPGAPPTQCRVPMDGGYRNIDDLEEGMAYGVIGPNIGG